jgi:hypothetical protein
LHQTKAHFDNGFDPSLIIAPLLTSIITCLIGGVLNLAAGYYAGREAAQLAQSIDAGRRAGIIVALIGSATWMGASIIAAFLTGTDSTLISIDPLDSTGIVQQDLGIVLIVAVRALICIGFSMIFVSQCATMGAEKGMPRQ